MTHFRDLTPYSYGAADSSEAGALNIGWLAAGVDFPMKPPDLQFVDRLWRFCRVSVGQTRAFTYANCVTLVRLTLPSEMELLLGSAEIRIISGQGQLYASPNLIFHHVVGHDYSPPPEFVRAVLMGPCPPEDGYYELLNKLGLEWSNTLIPDQSRKSFRFVKTPEGVVKVEE